MQADIDDDIEAHAAEGCHRLEQALVEAHDVGLEVGALAPGAQTDAGTAASGGDRGEGVDTEIQPETFERVLDGGGDARLPRPWHSVEDDHVPRLAHRVITAASSRGAGPPPWRSSSVSSGSATGTTIRHFVAHGAALITLEAEPDGLQ